MAFRVAVVGTGRMGKLHARVLSEMDDVELVCVVDSNEAAARSVARQRDCEALSEIARAVDKVDAAIIAVPTTEHINAAEPFVAAGRAVLIEKPISEDISSAKKLISLAKKNGAIIQIGHTERFNPAVIAMQKYAIRPKFIESLRVSPYTFRSADIGVVLDMMIHDIDLVLMLAGGNVKSLHAVGVNVIGAPEDICSARLIFDNGCVANMTASRLAIKTERHMRIFAEEAYLSVNYAKKAGVVYKKSQNLDLIQMAREYDAEDIAQLAESVDFTKLVKIEELVVSDTTEPLRMQAEAFRDAVTEGCAPTVSAEEGLAAVQVANNIVASIKQHRWDGKAFGRKGLDIIRKDS